MRAPQCRSGSAARAPLTCFLFLAAALIGCWAQAEADIVGYPLLVKAVMGGGGKGMKLAHSAAEFLVGGLGPSCTKSYQVAL